METIKVNMSPNPLDVQAIHASQNDGEARQWEFELHNNGDAIDSSSISDQLVFKAYKGGTEQILPENGSTPTTSPFIGDIKYPQGLLTDQEFLYRESPTEEDGLAKITDIKGNTLVWNQLADVKLASTSSGGITYTNNEDGSFTLNGTATAQVDFRISTTNGTDNLYNYPTGKYLLICNGISSSVQLIIMSYPDYVRMATFTSSPFLSLLPVTGRDNCFMMIRIANGTTLNNVKFKPQLFNLTAMFGSGNEPTSVSDFTSLFPLSYYSYNQGSLLSFMGNGIKTVGKNLFSGEQSYTRTSTGYYIREGNTSNPLPLKLAKGTYTISIKSTVAGTSQLEFFSGGITSADRFLAPYIILVEGVKTYTFTIDRQSDYIRLYGSFVGTISDIQIESGSTATPYEPYTSSTLSLPVSTYFPTGMKSAGSVYDELTPTKAITRIGAVNMGTLSWTRNANYEFFYATLTDGAIFTGAEDKDLLCPIYTTETTVNSTSLMSNVNDKTIRGRRGIASCQIYIKDTSYTSATDLVNALQGIPLYYELATPIETPITTASLVTENAEIPLSNEDGVLVGKCTEQLSSESGFIDAKIKLADEDGECYSNKLQLHVERSPQ